MRTIAFIVIFSPIFVNAIHLFSRDFSVDHAAKRNCTCVPIYLCPDEENPALDGSGILDVRSFDTVLCDNYYYICCKHPKRNNTSSKQEIIKCGYKSSLPMTGRITTNSEDTHFAELPWTVVILLKDEKAIDKPIYKCGGSLIHPQVVLSAAHCVNSLKASELIVRAGEWNTKTVSEPLHHQDLFPDEVIVHPKFKVNSLKNDIALIILTEEFVIVDSVGVICLPPHGFKLDNIRCIASGWGKNSMKKGRHASVMKKISLPIVSRAKCQSSLRSTRLGPFYTLHESFICAGGEQNKDTCKGDGGSPLVCPVKRTDSKRYFQIGIVSWGIGCGDSRTPGVYVNVAMFVDWIDAQMKMRNFDVGIYKL